MSNILLFLLGLGVFLLGIYILKIGLENIATFNIKKMIANFTSTPLKGCLTGTFITALLQSSRAVSVITIGLVDTGIMTFGQALGIILGTNIGTTITGQIMAFRLEALGWPFTFFGLIMLVLGKRMRIAGFILWGLGFIFLGMDIMGMAFSFVINNPLVKNLLFLTARSHLLAIIFGIIFTAIIQSSSAMTGIVLVLAKNGHLDLITSTAIILGSNVGTCFTAVLASIGASVNGKRVAAAHVVLNVLGVILLYPFLEQFTMLMSLSSTDVPRQIAHTHTAFNVFCSLVVLPFAGLFVKFIAWLVPANNDTG
ncbi:MAG: Na/Pi cotransporter family protein [Clostridia bacterium]|nr:Na/Pi cotransporter family protein [Clostridia bacterium]